MTDDWNILGWSWGDATTGGVLQRPQGLRFLEAGRCASCGTVMREASAFGRVDPMHKYCFPELGGKELGFIRVAGPGLGNMLLPWARAVLYAHQHSQRLIAPTWPQLKLGPVLRGETDFRSYTRQFRLGPNEIGGIRKAWLLAAARLDEENGTRRRRGNTRHAVRLFRGLGNFFQPLQDHGSFLQSALLATVRPELLPQKDATVSDVAIHVRCGDFAPITSGAHVPEEGVSNGQRLPVSCYVDALMALRAAQGRDLSATVFSDGTEDELRELLRMKMVKRSLQATAITDLLSISRHRVVIGSPHSTFSMWGAFLGNSQFITFPEAGRDYGLSPVFLRGRAEHWPGFLRSALA